MFQYAGVILMKFFLYDLQLLSCLLAIDFKLVGPFMSVLLLFFHLQVPSEVLSCIVLYLVAQSEKELKVKWLSFILSSPSCVT